jgi:hypothetical protein
MMTWRDFDRARVEIGGLSRAAMARWAGVNESTITKGIERDGTPTPAVQRKVRLVLSEAARLAGHNQGWLLQQSPRGGVVLDPATREVIAEIQSSDTKVALLIQKAPALAAAMKALVDDPSNELARDHARQVLAGL